MILWATLVYDPVAHWVWGDGGWLKNLGALDFAGGTVVHINAGIAALAAALVMGPRKGYSGHGDGTESFIPHNLPMTILGAALLWFGWFGFNAGSALAAGALASSAFTATHLATAAATLAWVGAEWIFRGKPTTLGAASGRGGRAGGHHPRRRLRRPHVRHHHRPARRDHLLPGGVGQTEIGL